MIDAERLHELLLEQERSRQREAEARRAAESLARCAGALAAAEDLPEVFARLLPEVMASLDADVAFILAAEAPGASLRVTAATDPLLLDRRWQRQGLLARLDARQGVASVYDVAQLPERLGGDRTVSAMLLYLGPEALLVCGSARRGHFQPGHLSLARTLAPIAVQAMARAEGHRRLRQEIAERMRVETELKRQQTALLHMHRMEAVAQLAAGMAHQINTPLQYAADNLRFLTGALATISGVIPTLTAWLEPHMDRDLLRQFLEMADIAYLTAEAPKSAEQCREGLDRVGAIVASLRRFAEAEPGPAEPADLNEAVRTTIEVCAGDLARVATVDTALADLPAVPCRVGEIRQVLHALLMNAMHAIEDRPGSALGRITIASRCDGAHVEIAVSDDGVGMDAEVLRRACEPFFTTRPFSGSGQGLAIAHEVASRHGGELRLASAPDAGTTATLRLPICPGPAPGKGDGGVQPTTSSTMP